MRLAWKRCCDLRNPPALAVVEVSVLFENGAVVYDERITLVRVDNKTSQN
jgi:hypothetical protein